MRFLLFLLNYLVWCLLRFVQNWQWIITSPTYSIVAFGSLPVATNIDAPSVVNFCIHRISHFKENFLVLFILLLSFRIVIIITRLGELNKNILKSDPLKERATNRDFINSQDAIFLMVNFNLRLSIKVILNVSTVFLDLWQLMVIH